MLIKENMIHDASVSVHSELRGQEVSVWMRIPI